MIKKYKFRLDVEAGEIEVFPRYNGSDLNRNAEPVPNQIFLREKLSSDLTFLRNDFQAILDSDIEHEFIIHIDRRNAALTGYDADWYVGKFTRTDCDIDEDQRRLTVQPETHDLYGEILEGMEKEFDLIALAPATVSVNIKIQPLVQIYMPGSSIVTNILSGVYWEQDTLFTNIESFELENNYFFGNNLNLFFIPGENGANLVPDVSGTYDEMTLLRLDGNYQIVTTDLGGGNFRHEIIDKFDSDTVVYQAPINESITTEPPHAAQGALFTSLTSASTCRAFGGYFFVRLLTNETEVQGNPTNAIPEDDIVARNENYDYVIGISHDKFLAYDGNSTTPDRFGKIADNATNFAGNYFSPAYFSPSSGIPLTYPIARSEWTECSWWFYYDSALKTLQEDGGTQYVLKHAYKLVDCIAVLLAEIAPDVSHLESSTYSDFFYAATNAIRGSRKYPIIAPKSNVIINEYDKPAQRAKVRLSDILNLIRDFHQAYWDLKDGDKLRLEHVDFHDRGGSYTTTVVGTDLTSQFSPRNGKKWSAETNKYKYEKQDMPQEIRHKWMDKCSEPFEGYPIGVRSNYAQKGNFDERNLSLFTSDIDMIHGTPDAFSLDGFVFMECEAVSETLYELPFVEIELEWPYQWKMQNGWASIVYAHETYWRHHLPAMLVTLNLADITAYSAIRTKLQELTFPAIVEPAHLPLVTSEIGNGKLKSSQYNVTTGETKINVLHDTE